MRMGNAVESWVHVPCPRLCDLLRRLLIQHTKELRWSRGSLFLGLDKVYWASSFVIRVDVDVLHEALPEVVRLVGNDP